MKLENLRSIKPWWIVVLSLSLVAVFLVRPVSSVAVDDKPVNFSLNPSVPNSGFADLVEAVAPAVVSVDVFRTEVVPSSNQRVPGGMPDFWHNFDPKSIPPQQKEFFDFFFDKFGDSDMFGPRSQQKRWKNRQQQRKLYGNGSGVIIAPDGYVITNYHVVDGAEGIKVIMDDGTEYQAQLVGTDKFSDLAVLKIEGNSVFPYVEFGDSNKSRVGDWVIAIGNPFGLSGTVTFGVLSATARKLGGGSPNIPLMQVDAAINKGNSGGPLFNTSGQVIGLNTLIFSPTGMNVGVGFAVPASVLESVSNSLISKGHVTRGQLGVMIQPVTAELAQALGLESESNNGALVADVTPKSAADQAGIQSGDVIVEFDGQIVETMQALPPLVRNSDPGKEVSIVIVRDGKRMTLTAKLEEHSQVAALQPEQKMGKQMDNEAPIGVVVAKIDPENRQKFQIDEDVEGIVIVAVAEDSPAKLAGLQVGDIIRSINQVTVDTPGKVKELIVALETDMALLLIQRNASKFFTVVNKSRINF